MTLSALYIIPILGILILLHELGHFVTARRAGMKVEEFGFGIPPRLWGFRRGDTLYSINAIPLGGFVKVLGEDGKEYSNQSMQSKSIGQRALFITAGSIMNFLTAFVLVVALVGFQGQSTQNSYVMTVVPDSPAAQAGWQPGDRFVSVDNHEVHSVDDVAKWTGKFVGQPVEVTMARGEQLVQTTIVPRIDPPEGQGPTGIEIGSAPQAVVRVETVNSGSALEAMGLREGDELLSAAGRSVTDYLAFEIQTRQHAGQTMPVEVRRNGQVVTLQASVPADVSQDAVRLGGTILSDAIYQQVPTYEVPVKATRQYFSTIKDMGAGVISLLRGDEALSSVAGPIGMGQLTSEVIDHSAAPLWVTLFNIGFILSLNLGLLNLLPLPALDGGRLAFIVVEIVRRGKRVAPEKEGMVHFVGLVVLLTLMFVIAFVDIDRVISGTSFIQ